MNGLRKRILALSVPGLVLAGVLVGSPAGAATSGPVGVYPAWTISPEDPAVKNHSGTIYFGIVGLPDATYTVNKTNEDGDDTELTTADDSGDWFTTDTPFGEVFGASGPSTSIQFIKTRVDEDTKATTTVTFASPVPANVLGFAVSDIDVDELLIAGTGADGSAVTGDQLAGTTFNFCNVVDPKPDTCDGVEPPYAVPTWNPANGTVSDPADEDSDGASASFRPTVAISSLTFTFSSLGGSPSYRLWFAALSSSVTGAVSFPAGSAKVPVTMNLLDTDGSILATTTTDDSGNYSFAFVVASPGLRIELVAPSGFSVDGSTTIDIDLDAGSVEVPFTLISGGQVVPAYTG